jgi:hypothetical protein
MERAGVLVKDLLRRQRGGLQNDAISIIEFLVVCQSNFSISGKSPLSSVSSVPLVQIRCLSHATNHERINEGFTLLWILGLRW